MKEYDVVLTRRAKNDIIDIGDYISYTLLEPETAYRFVTGLRSAISTLQKLPNRFALVDDQVLSTQGIHCMLLPSKIKQKKQDFKSALKMGIKTKKFRNDLKK